MTIARAVAVGALALAVVVVAFFLLRGGGGTEYKLRLQTASGLVKNNEVQVGGRKVGSIKNIDLTDDNQAEVTISLDDAFAPLHEGTTATTRALSLSGIANRYIALSPGPNNTKALPDGATLTTEKTTSLVDLDQLFDAFDAPTRNGLRNVIQGFAAQYSGRTLNGQVTSSEFNRSTQYFSPFLSSTDALVQQLLRDQPALNRFLVDTSRVVTTLSTRRDDLSALVGNANTTAAAIASEDASLSQTLGQLPTTLRKANTTFVNLRSTLDDLDVLVNASKPATKRLEPFLKALRPLVADAKPTIRDLRRLIREPGDANDAIDLLNRAPALATAGRRAFPSTVAALQGSQEVVQYLRPFGPEAIGYLRDFGQTASNYDANGHFARIQPIFNAFQLDPSGSVLTAVPPALRGLGAQTGLTERCPGAASQPRPDGSNPFLDGGRLVPGTDCDPSQVPPGP